MARYIVNASTNEDLYDVSRNLLTGLVAPNNESPSQTTFSRKLAIPNKTEIRGDCGRNVGQARDSRSRPSGHMSST